VNEEIEKCKLKSAESEFNLQFAFIILQFAMSGKLPAGAADELS
jgi:hypothetical protein